MDEFITAISTGFTAFTVTNLDDIIMLLLFFSQVNTVLQRRHIVAGQYLGFAALIIASLPGFFGSLFLPRPWIGLLGVVPIAIGIHRLLNQDTDDASEEVALEQPSTSWLSSLLSPQAYSIAAVTIANGSDNIGIYMPLFAGVSWQSLLSILGVFFSLVGVWCFIAYKLTQLPAIAAAITRYGNYFVPFVFIAIGVLILLDSHTLESHSLAGLTVALGSFCLMILSRTIENPSDVLTEAERN